MYRFIIRRLLQMVVTFLGATFIVYALMFANQDNPVQALAGDRPITPAVQQMLNQQYHLDKPFLVQYGYYMKGLLAGDFGKSLGGREISDMLLQAWPITVKLGALAVLFVILFGITGGVIAGLRRGGVFDTTSLAATLVLVAIPIIVLAPLAQLVFAVQWKIFPVTAGANPGVYQLLLPAIVLGSLATTVRLTRTSVAENLRADYVRTAKAKGLTPRRVVGVHVLRNSLIPVITSIGVDVGTLMGGAIITEGVFNIPGVGFNLFRGIRIEDGPVVVGFVSILVLVYLISSLLVDLLYAVLDPRIRYE